MLKKSHYFSEFDYILIAFSIVHCSLIIWVATGILVNLSVVPNQGILHEYTKHPILIFGYIFTIIPCLVYLMISSWHTSRRMIFVAGIFNSNAIYFFISGFFLFEVGDLSWTMLFILAARIFYAGEKNL